MKIVTEHLTAMYHYAIIYDRKAVDNMKKTTTVSIRKKICEPLNGV